MLTTNTSLINAFKEPAREVTGGVRIYEGSTISQTLLPTDTLANVTINRSAPAGKFFGFTIAQQLTVEVLGKINLAKGTQIQPYMGIKGQTPAELPYFYVDSVTIDETKNKTVIKAYDLMGKADKVAIDEIGITYPFTIQEFATTIVTALGGTLIADFEDINPVYSDLSLVNLAGSETARSVLSSIAEVAGVIIYCSTGNTIVAKGLSSEVKHTLNGDDYFNFATEDAIILTQIASTTQLNDNIYVGEEGYTQVIWDNPFLTLREDIAELLEAIGNKVIGTFIIPYSLDWRGNPFYEIGDLIQITTLKGEVKNIYYFNDTLIYNGGLKSISDWESSDSGNIEAAPTSLGATLKQTVAKIDKVNNRIELVAAQNNEVREEMATMRVETNGIFTEVRETQSDIFENITAINSDMDAISQKVQTAITSENISIEIQKELSENGVNSVTTTTGFTFDEVGLTIDKSGTEMSTTITEDGMTVYRDDTGVLIANNIGVEATNLHAKTYLIIGKNSRLEDYNETRTGMFWIGQ